jgi:hypothetical protein
MRPEAAETAQTIRSDDHRIPDTQGGDAAATFRDTIRRVCSDTNLRATVRKASRLAVTSTRSLSPEESSANLLRILIANFNQFRVGKSHEEASQVFVALIGLYIIFGTNIFLYLSNRLRLGDKAPDTGAHLIQAIVNTAVKIQNGDVISHLGGHLIAGGHHHCIARYGYILGLIRLLHDRLPLLHYT